MAVLSSPPAPSESVFSIPNQLTLLRLLLSIVLFVLISLEQWLVCLAVFAAAALTDWLDGFIARRYNLGSTLGRNFDPFVDKILIGGAYIFLIPIAGSGLQPWMVVVVVSRELLVTTVRSFFEGKGIKFGADWGGKIKMVLQCATLIAILVYKLAVTADDPGHLWIARDVLIYAMVISTVASGLQYLVKTYRLALAPGA